MFHRRFFTFFLLLPTVFISSCQKENAFDCLKSSGRITTETRELPTFTKLRVLDNLDVKIVADSEHFAEVKAGENLQKNIRTEVKNGELWVQNINKCNWVRSYDRPFEVTIHVQKLTDILHDSDGTISSENPIPADTVILHLNAAGDFNLNLNTQYVWLDMYELGDMKLSGTNHTLNANVHSLGRLQARDLQNQEAYVFSTNLGDAYLEANRLLVATIDGKGSVFYRNPPNQKIRKGKGSGQLLQAE